MKEPTLAFAALAAVIYAVPASAHGCHADGQLSLREGWHAHGRRCEMRQGIGLGHPSKARPGQQAHRQAPIWRGYPQSR